MNTRELRLECSVCLSERFRDVVQYRGRFLIQFSVSGDLLTR